MSFFGKLVINCCCGHKNKQVSNYIGGKKVLVGVYRTDVEEPYLEWRNGGIKWKGRARFFTQEKLFF